MRPGRSLRLAVIDNGIAWRVARVESDSNEGNFEFQFALFCGFQHASNSVFFLVDLYVASKCADLFAANSLDAATV